LPNGDLLAVLIENDVMVSRIIPPSGPIGNANRLYDFEDNLRAVEIAPLGGGSAAVLYTELDGGPLVDDYCQLLLQIVTPSGLPLNATPITVAFNDEETDTLLDGRVTVLANGQIVVAWSEKPDPDTGTYDISFSIYAQNGTLIEHRDNVNSPQTSAISA
jgi:hypothetical protein